MTRATRPTTAEERDGWRAEHEGCPGCCVNRMLDDLAERDATIAALTQRAEAAERERELLPASTPKRGSLPCVYCHGTGAECTRCDGTGTQPEGEERGR